MDRFVGSSGLWHSQVVGDSNIGTAFAGCRPLRQPPQCWVIRQERSRCWNWLSRRSSMWRCYEATDQSGREEWGDHRRLLQDLWMWFCHRLVVCWYVYQCICPRREEQYSVGAVGFEVCSIIGFGLHALRHKFLTLYNWLLTKCCGRINMCMQIRTCSQPNS